MSYFREIFLNLAKQLKSGDKKILAENKTEEKYEHIYKKNMGIIPDERVRKFYRNKYGKTKYEEKNAEYLDKKRALLIKAIKEKSGQDVNPKAGMSEIYELAQKVLGPDHNKKYNIPFSEIIYDESVDIANDIVDFWSSEIDMKQQEALIKETVGYLYILDHPDMAEKYGISIDMLRSTLDKDDVESQEILDVANELIGNYSSEQITQIETNRAIAAKLFGIGDPVITKDNPNSKKDSAKPVEGKLKDEDIVKILKTNNVVISPTNNKFTKLTETLKKEGLLDDKKSVNKKLQCFDEVIKDITLVKKAIDSQDMKNVKSAVQKYQKDMNEVNNFLRLINKELGTDLKGATGAQAGLTLIHLAREAEKTNVKLEEHISEKAVNAFYSAFQNDAGGWGNSPYWAASFYEYMHQWNNSEIAKWKNINFFDIPPFNDINLKYALGKSWAQFKTFDKLLKTVMDDSLKMDERWEKAFKNLTEMQIECMMKYVSLQPELNNLNYDIKDISESLFINPFERLETMGLTAAEIFKKPKILEAFIHENVKMEGIFSQLRDINLLKAYENSEYDLEKEYDAEVKKVKDKITELQNNQELDKNEQAKQIQENEEKLVQMRVDHIENLNERYVNGDITEKFLRERMEQVGRMEISQKMPRMFEGNMDEQKLMCAKFYGRKMLVEEKLIAAPELKVPENLHIPEVGEPWPKSKVQQIREQVSLDNDVNERVGRRRVETVFVNKNPRQVEKNPQIDPLQPKNKK